MRARRVAPRESAREHILRGERESIGVTLILMHSCTELIQLPSDCHENWMTLEMSQNISFEPRVQAGSQLFFSGSHPLLWNVSTTLVN